MSLSRPLGPRVAPLAGALFLAVCGLASPAHASETGCEEKVSTRPVTFSVVLPDDSAYNVAGFLYWRGQLQGKVLQIAIPGGTYNHRYWDADELNGHEYSYARYMACHGFAVLAVDNLGVGASSKPAGDFVTIPVEAIAMHQIIQGVRGGELGASFRKIVLVGHSMGSQQAIFEQGTYRDADALVVTGWENTPHPVDMPADILSLIFGAPYSDPPGWVRTALFYAGNFDPAMPDYDNAHLADQMPRGLFTNMVYALMGFAPTASAGVTGPVLLVFDEYDVFAPLSLAAGEPATYPNASSVTTHVVYGIGHDLNLHLANTEEWARIKSWIREGVDGGAEDDAG